MREHVHHAVHQGDVACGAVQRVPSVLHGQAEAGRHWWTGRAVRAPLRPKREEVLTGSLAPRDGSVDSERLQRLRQVKLEALVRAYQGEGSYRTEALPAGASLIDDERRAGWALLDRGGAEGLGAALIWAARRPVESLEVVVDLPDRTAVAVVARRAPEFRLPVRVHALEGDRLMPAPERSLDAAAAPALLPLDIKLLFEEMIAAGGAEPVWEHGSLTAEVLGLEVGRVVEVEGQWQLQVGVGGHDRRARLDAYGERDPLEALGLVASFVGERRRPGRMEQASTLSRERWLREAIVSEPESMGALRLFPSDPPVPRSDLRKHSAAPAVGIGSDGRAVVVVCSVGFDPDLVPTAADCRLLADSSERSLGEDGRLVIAMPEGDLQPVTSDVNEMLLRPAEIVPVEPPWA